MVTVIGDKSYRKYTAALNVRKIYYVKPRLEKQRVSDKGIH